MAHFFHANEIANIAIKIERRGREFYLQAVDRAETPRVKEMFKHLAEEEAKHEGIFRSMLARLGKVGVPPWATQDEYMQYIEALIESHMLFNSLGQKFLERAESEKEVIEAAMGFEKDTMLFFLEMEELVPSSEKYAVHQCYEEERKHLRELSRASAQLEADAA
ncbi:ferritin-like domain-containing protein [Pseudodesulfovibrio portus]|uniref:Rubrerythrin n=1 Tax=Pseudodesulfovibrio portus TaxID=231439 RepID=A0ABM8AW01_9BACT|nr:ferritin family protein [Pseudodesulfovibrio portus]BDQ35594.1 rubrerythrin [Pseudodesulfovibrio portus]